MSIAAYAWAKSQRAGSPTLKAVLMAVADYADELGRAWPSQARIADDTELTDRTIRTALADLEAMGFLRREERRRADGSRSTDILHLDIANANNRKLLPGVRKELPTPRNPTAPQPAPVSRGAERASGLELPNNYQLNDQKSSEAKASGAAAPDDDLGDDPSEEQRELYKRGRKVLGKGSGGVITSLVKFNGGNIALARADIERASQAGDAMEFIQGILRGEKRGPPKSLFPLINGHDDFNPEALKAARRQREQAAAGRIQ